MNLLECAKGQSGVNSVGTMDHPPFRLANDKEQLRWQKKLTELDLNVTPVIDRYYFHSIYFREPGGILFEIATEGPGFTADEQVKDLGQTLKLPPQYEQHRAEIERALPPILIEAKAKTAG